MRRPSGLAWLDATLAAEPTKPTIVVMHHPSFDCGIRHMDKIKLRRAEQFNALIARHSQVQRILCGHHHRVITTQIAQATAMIGPGVAHIVTLDLFSDNVGQWALEPASYYVHAWVEGAGIISHQAWVESYPGPYPFTSDPE